jgi:hypothetical protein
MNTLFVLFATLHLNSGVDSYYALDTGITGEDCITAMIALQPMMASNVTLSCEFDAALPIDAE